MRHVFVSDLHLSDGTLGTSVSESTLLRHLLDPLSAAAPVTLVLVGDIFELLRSDSWGPGVDPWVSVNAGFKNFSGLVREKVEHITATIVSRYSKFSAELKLLVEQKKVFPVFIPGNHDYMLQLAPEARRSVHRFLSLPETAKVFPSFYYHQPSGIYAVHGNKYDPVNWHDEAGGQWAFGDAIVLRLVNGFIRFASERLQQRKTEPDTPLAQAIQDLDNVEPNTDLPLFFRHIMERHLANPADRDAVLASWRKAVGDLLSIEHFRVTEGSRTWALRKTLEASTNQTLAKLAATFAQYWNRVTDPDTGDRAYSAELSKATAIGKPARVFVFGHTHNPEIRPLASAPEHPRYAINIGCWRRVVRRLGGSTDFVPRQVYSLLWVETDSDGHYCYRLEREEEVR